MKEMNEGWKKAVSKIKKVRRLGSWYQIEMENGVKLIARTVSEFREPRKREEEV